VPGHGATQAVPFQDCPLGHVQVLLAATQVPLPPHTHPVALGEAALGVEPDTHVLQFPL